MKENGPIAFLNEFEKWLFSNKCDGRLHVIRDKFEQLKIKYGIQ